MTFENQNIHTIIQQKYFDYGPVELLHEYNSIKQFRLFDNKENNKEIGLFTNDTKTSNYSLYLYQQQISSFYLRKNKNLHFLIGKPASAPSTFLNINTTGDMGDINNNNINYDFLFNGPNTTEIKDSYESPDIKYIEEFAAVINNNDKINGLSLYTYNLNCNIDDNIINTTNNIFSNKTNINIEGFDNVDFAINGFNSKHTISEK